MLSFEDHVFLMETRGLPVAAVRHLASDQAGGATARRLADKVERQRLLGALGGFGLRPSGPVVCPCREDMRNLVHQLRRVDARLLWRGQADYPKRLETRLGNDAPHWAWLAGPRERLEGPACAFVGSRQAAELFLKAAPEAGARTGRGGRRDRQWAGRGGRSGRPCRGARSGVTPKAVRGRWPSRPGGC